MDQFIRKEKKKGLVVGIFQVLSKKRILFGKFENKSISEKPKWYFLFFQESIPFKSNELKQGNSYSLFILLTTKNNILYKIKIINENNKSNNIIGEFFGEKAIIMIEIIRTTN